MTASVLAAACGVLLPLAIVLMHEQPHGPASTVSPLWLYCVGAATAVMALLVERLLLVAVSGPAPPPYATVVEAFVVVGLTEEAVKLSIFWRLWIERRFFDFRDFAKSALYVAAGFAGAENIGYVWTDASWTATLAIRCFTAVPFHLANAVVAAALISRTADAEVSGWLAAALVVSALLHGAYDYPLMARNTSSLLSLLVLGAIVATALRLYARAQRRPTPWR